MTSFGSKLGWTDWEYFQGRNRGFRFSYIIIWIRNKSIWKIDIRNWFLPCTQRMRRLTISLLALPSSCKFWKINIVLLKDIDHDLHIISEEIYFNMWTSSIITCGSLSLSSSPPGSWATISRTRAFWTWFLLLFLLLLRIFLISMGLIWYTSSKGLILVFDDGTHFYELVLFFSQRLHEIY